MREVLGGRMSELKIYGATFEPGVTVAVIRRSILKLRAHNVTAKKISVAPKDYRVFLRMISDMGLELNMAGHFFFYDLRVVMDDRLESGEMTIR